MTNEEKKKDLCCGDECPLKDAEKYLENCRNHLRDVMKPAEKAAKELENATATDKVRLQGTKETKAPNLKPYTESIPAKNRQEVSKLIAQARAENRPWKIQRCNEALEAEGYRYTFLTTTESDAKLFPKTNIINNEKLVLSEDVELIPVETPDEYETIEVGGGEAPVEAPTDEPAPEDTLPDDENKPMTFEEQMDFLAADEDEAIAGYEQIIGECEDEHVKEQLEKILIEERAHKEFLMAVKEDHSLEYSHEEEEEEDEEDDENKEDEPEDKEPEDKEPEEDEDFVDGDENESLNEEKEEDGFFYKWRKNLQDKYHISPLGSTGGTYYIHVAQGIDPSGHVCAGYRDPTQEELVICVKEAEALGQKAEIVDKDHIRVIEGLDEASSAEKRAFKNGGEDMDDLVTGRALARVKNPEERAMLLHQKRMEKQGKKMSDRPEASDTLKRKEDQVLTDIEKKEKKMAAAGMQDADEELLNENAKIELDDLELFKPWGGAKDVWQLIKDQDKLAALDEVLERFYPDGLQASKLNDILWFEQDWLLDELDIDPTAIAKAPEDDIIDGEAEVIDVEPEEESDEQK